MLFTIGLNPITIHRKQCSSPRGYKKCSCVQTVRTRLDLPLVANHCCIPHMCRCCCEFGSYVLYTCFHPGLWGCLVESMMVPRGLDRINQNVKDYKRCIQTGLMLYNGELWGYMLQLRSASPLISERYCCILRKVHYLTENYSL